jgi:hypothetical protein
MRQTVAQDAPSAITKNQDHVIGSILNPGNLWVNHRCYSK